MAAKAVANTPPDKRINFNIECLLPSPLRIQFNTTHCAISIYITLGRHMITKTKCGGVF